MDIRQEISERLSRLEERIANRKVFWGDAYYKTLITGETRWRHDEDEVVFYRRVLEGLK